MYFLNFLVFRWKYPMTMTPIMPDITGLPPTTPTAKGRSLLNHGFKRYDSTIESALKMPK